MATETTYDWAIRVHCAIRDIPGPHILESGTEDTARRRFAWWQNNHRDVRAELLRREVVTTVGDWTEAS